MTQTTEYKHIMFGEKFVHNGTEYIKCNFDRGYRMVDGKRVYENFKNKRRATVTVERND